MVIHIGQSIYKESPMVEGALALQREYRLVLGIPINNLNINELSDICLTWMQASESGKNPKYMSTVNSDFIVNAIGWTPLGFTNPELDRCLLESDLATPDGMPLVWFSKLCGKPLESRVSGIDLLLEIAKEVGKKKESIFFFGGDEKTATSAAKILEETNPGLKIAGILCNKVDINDDEEIARSVEIINQSGAHLLLLNLGNPKQELWFKHAKSKLNVPLSIGVGGSFAFIAHTIPRAPLWMQQWGLEWIYRLKTEPRRLWKRYTFDLFKFGFLAGEVIIFDFFYRLIAKHYKNSARLQGISFQKGGEWQVLLPSNLQEEGQYMWFYNQMAEGLNHKVVLLDFSAVHYFDIRYLGLLIHALIWAEKRQMTIRLVNIPKSLKSYFYMHHVLDVINKHHLIIK